MEAMRAASMFCDLREGQTTSDDRHTIARYLICMDT